jgi:hypothetical protein
MRFASLILLFLAPSFISLGQSSANSSPKSLQKEFSLLVKRNTAAKTTNTASRVKSYLVEVFNGTTFINYDSVLFQWSGQHGGDLQHFPVKYDSYLTIQWNPTVSIWQGFQQGMQTFDINDNIATTSYKNWNGGVWDNSYRNVYSSYDANNNILVEIAQNWNITTSTWVNGSKFTNTYTSNKLDATLTEVWNGTGWDNYDKLTYGYLPNGDLDFFIRQSWNASTSSWVNTERGLMSYDVSGDLVEEFAQLWDAGTSSWKNDKRYVYTNVNHLPSTIIDQTWNSSSNTYVSSMRRTYTYNSYDQILTRVAESWDAGANTWTYQAGNTKYNIHYEEYTTAVNDISRGGESNIYPSPAKDVVNIYLSWNVQQSFSIAIYDMQGRVMKQWDESPAKEYRIAVKTSELPAGSYYVRIQGEKGLMVKSLTVIH